MLETTLQVTYWAAAVYVSIGILFTAQLYLRGLHQKDPACGNTGFLFRILILPGLITLWPLVARHRSDSKKAPVAANPSLKPTVPGRRRVGYLIPAAILVLSSAIIILLTLLPEEGRRFERDIPPGTFPEPPWARLRVVYGTVFPSIPANVFLGREIGHWGLEFKFKEGHHAPPVAFYWAPRLATGEGLPEDAVFLGTVSGPDNSWIRFSGPTMHAEGYWIAYSFLNHQTDIYPVPLPTG